MRNILKLAKHEAIDYVQNPPLLVLVLLPVVMSKIIIGVMGMAGQEIMLLSSWVLFAQVMVGIMLTGPNMLEERTAKTIDALLITPLSYPMVLLGKGLTILSLSLISQLLVITVNGALPSLSLPLLLILLLGGILFTGVGFAVGMWMNSIKGGTAVSSVLMVTFFLIGTIYEALPDWKGVLTILPSIQVAENIQSILNGEGLLGLETVLLVGWTAAVSLLVYRKARMS